MPRRVRTRFAPSPTGPLHIGGVRTALYNFLFAKKHRGDFLLRIEDTDRNRYVAGAEDYIIEALRWCGITIDEGVPVGGPHHPYRQSERKELGIYSRYAQQLVDSGNAYLAFDTPESLEAMRNRHIAAGNVAPQYDHRTRGEMENSLTLSSEEIKKRLASGTPYVIRLKVPPSENIAFNDLIRGEVSFDTGLVDDKVLIKSDGMPTYHLAHIVDDVLMEISHAIRGEEWLPSAPAHLLIYRYLGWEDRMPQYVHLPLLLKPDGHGKLSKRDGDRLGFPVFPLDWTDPETGEASSGYREKGYYPEAFVNMLAMLGWNPGTEQELFPMEELIEAFSFDHVHKAGARFDPEKARWFNEQYLRKQPDEKLAMVLKREVQQHLQLPEADHRLSNSFLTGAVALLKERVQFGNELFEKGRYLFEAPASLDEQVLAKKWKEEYRPFFADLTETLKVTSPFDRTTIDTAIKTIAAKHRIKPGEIMQLLRVFISGLGAGVDLMGMMMLMGQEECVKRLKVAMGKISG